jgi:urea transport system substrate-binding protein
VYGCLDYYQTVTHAKIDARPGGPAEMVPGQHHARLNMYIAQTKGGGFEVLKNLGVVEPNERLVSEAVTAV